MKIDLRFSQPLIYRLWSTGKEPNVKDVIELQLYSIDNFSSDICIIVQGFMREEFQILTIMER
jgi:hypothetical protein